MHEPGDHDRLVVVETKLETVESVLLEMRADVKKLVRFDHYISAISIFVVRMTAIAAAVVATVGLAGRILHLF